MNYAEMSDFEINRAVLIAAGIDYEDISDVPIGGGSAIAFGDGCKWREYDFCNNPADAWPLIVENHISLAFWGGEWEADCNAYWVDGAEWQFDGYRHSNPLRAVAIVYLMMKEAGK